MKPVNTIPFRFAMDNMFVDFFNQNQELRFPSRVHQKEALNIEEYDEEFLIQVIAPGYTKADFSIELENNLLTVEAKASEKERKDPVKTIRRDYTMNGFKKTFHVDSEIIAAPSSARYQNGILSISIPKVQKEQQVKKTIGIL